MEGYIGTLALDRTAVEACNTRFNELTAEAPGKLQHDFSGKEISFALTWGLPVVLIVELTAETANVSVAGGVVLVVTMVES
jgi:hypothetical protein